MKTVIDCILELIQELKLAKKLVQSTGKSFWD